MENTDKNYVVKYNKELMEFIDNSPTAFQAIDQFTEKLLKAGFREMDERKVWENHRKGFVVRNHSSIIAYNTHNANKDSDIKGFRIICSHSDSPAFKIKMGELPKSNEYTRINVEKYGGMIVSSWFDRPLSAAGRIVYKSNGKLVHKNIDIKKDAFIIPNLAIHMSGGVSKDDIKIQNDMLPVTIDKDIYEYIEELGINKDDILGMDLFVYNAQKSGLIGEDNPMLYAPRIDDLLCAYTSIDAIISNSNISNNSDNLDDTESQYVDIVCVFDNEEVGSLTKQGAESDFLLCTLKNILEGMGINENRLRHMLADSFMISADNAHAIHPAHPEKADIINRPMLNKGIVIKYHGGQKYTTDALSGAVVKKICEDNDIPVQLYYNNSDVAGGSTLGNLIQSNVSVRAADIGVAQLAMHSAMETSGAVDTVYMYEFMKAFLNSRGTIIDEKN